MKVERSADRLEFQRLYVGFEALRKGFLVAYRPLIELDGCFLKWICKDKLLVAIDRDANNQMHPIVQAVIEVECKNSWSWFINLLTEDLGLGDSLYWIVGSDQQKVNFSHCLLYKHHAYLLIIILIFILHVKCRD